MSDILSEPSNGLLATRNAAHSSVAVFDVSDRTQIEIMGTDRARFLHSFTSNDIKRLKPGQGCETFVTNLKGKVVAHVFVFCGEHSLWLDGTPGQQEALIGHLGKFLLIDDVQLIPRNTERGELLVTGPLAPQLLQLDDGLAVASHVTRGTGDESFDVRRVDLLGTPGFLLSIPRSRRDAVKFGLTSLGIAEGSRELFEMLRIEAGYPRYGVDITEDNLAQEVARTKQCISFDKGCYLGQETIARIDALGHTNQELRQMAFESIDVPPAGSPVFDATGTNEVGVITSATNDIGSTSGGRATTLLALGLVKRIACPANTPVQLRIGNQTATGRVL